MIGPQVETLEVWKHGGNNIVNIQRPSDGLQMDTGGDHKHSNHFQMFHRYDGGLNYNRQRLIVTS